MIPPGQPIPLDTHEDVLDPVLIRDYPLTRILIPLIAGVLLVGVVLYTVLTGNLKRRLAAMLAAVVGFPLLLLAVGLLLLAVVLSGLYLIFPVWSVAEHPSRPAAYVRR